MTTNLETSDKDFEQMMQMLTGFFVTQIAGAVATYSIADHLAKGPATAEEIATIEGIDSTATFRLLRACAELGLVTCDDGLTFRGTSLLGTLRANVPGSLHGLAIAWSAPGHWLPSGKFTGVQTGRIRYSSHWDSNHGNWAKTSRLQQFRANVGKPPLMRLGTDTVYE